MNSRPSTTITYLLWFFFGILGIHHIYLDNINRAIICCLTFNFFFLGWIYDLMNLDSYIQECSIFTQVNEKIPPISIFRIFCNAISSLFFSSFIRTMFPFIRHFIIYLYQISDKIFNGDSLLLEQLGLFINVVLQLLIVCFNIWGIKFFSRSTKTTSSFTLMFWLDLLYIVKRNYKMPFTSLKVVFWELSIINAILFEAKRRRMSFGYSRRRNILVRFFLYLFGVMAIFTMFLSIVFVNIEINHKGKQEKLYKVIYDKMTDAQFLAILKIFGREVKVFYSNCRTVGFTKAFNTSFNEEGANNIIDDDLKILGITENIVTHDIIKRRYRKLVQKWHPDVTKENKEEAEKKMRQINDSFERLRKIYK